MIVSDITQLYILLREFLHFSISYCSWSTNLSWLSAAEFCFLTTKNLILHGFSPDSVVAFFTSQAPNTKHLFNHCFSQKNVFDHSAWKEQLFTFIYKSLTLFTKQLFVCKQTWSSGNLLNKITSEVKSWACVHFSNLNWKTT